MEPVILTFCLLLMLFLFISEKMPPEISALTVIFGLVLLSELNIGLHFLTAQEAMQGLANEAVVTVACMFVISAGLMRSGVIGYIGDRLISLSGGKPVLVFLFSIIAVAFSSAFINNTPIVVLFMPLMLRVCFRYNLSPSKYLIPISYASILGGTTTLIGTSTNIIVSGIAAKIAIERPELGLHTFNLFEFTGVGVINAAIGLAFLFFIGRHILPNRGTFTASIQGLDPRTYVTELEIGPLSIAINKTVSEALLARYPKLQVLEIIRGEEIIYPPVDEVFLQRGDILLVRGSVNDFVMVQQDRAAGIPELLLQGISITEKNYTLAEVAIMPGSRYIGYTIGEVQFKRRYRLNVIAVMRQGKHLQIREKLMKIRLRIGDILLVQGDETAIAALRQAENLQLVEGVVESVVDRRKAPIAISVMAAVVALATLNVMPIVVLAFIGALTLIITNCVPLKFAYKSLNGSVLLLIAATIALGTVLKNTGTAEIYGSFMASALAPLGPVAVLAGIFLLTTTLTEMMSNNATAVLMTHIAVAIAVNLGYQPMPFVITVLFGASACFATPIGYQTNLLVYGPGGYKFSDFARIGIFMNILVWIVAIIFIPMFWPLTPLK